LVWKPEEERQLLGLGHSWGLRKQDVRVRAEFKWWTPVTMVINLRAAKKGWEFPVQLVTIRFSRNTLLHEVRFKNSFLNYN
jgi:hypothetical protein